MIAVATTREPAAPLLAPDANPAEMCVGEGEGEDGRLCFDAVIPELADEGSDHLIVLTEVDDPAFLERLAAFGDYADAFQGPALWVVAPIGDEALEAFQFEHQPAFEVLACPRVLVEAMDGALPAAFRVRDGRVTTIWENWPPLDELQAEAADDPGEDADDGTDDGSEPGDNAGDSDSDDSPVDGGAEDGSGAPDDGASDDDSGGGFRDEDDR